MSFVQFNRVLAYAKTCRFVASQIEFKIERKLLGAFSFFANGTLKQSCIAILAALLKVYDRAFTLLIIRFVDGRKERSDSPATLDIRRP